MTDIVERLRRVSLFLPSFCERCGTPNTDPYGNPYRAERDKLCGEAADEIERLRHLVEKAYNEGFGEGMNDVLRQSGGTSWYDSRSRKAIEGQDHD
jgi:hypothetical protein